MRTSDFDYELPPELIAQAPAPDRDQSRLLVLQRPTGEVAHERFTDLPHHLRSGDLLVLNNSRVLPARLRAQKTGTGGAIELLLVEEISANEWWVLLRPGKRVRAGTRFVLQDRGGRLTTITGAVLGKNPEGHCRIFFSGTPNILGDLDGMGEIPLPPYIHREEKEAGNLFDRERYQTIYAEVPGSVAAPTAGLHFSKSLLDQIRKLGAQIEYVTLHVGLGTFAPVKAEEVSQHTLHEESFEVSSAVAAAINVARAQRRRIIAVGTTTVRVLESVAALNQGRMAGERGRTRIFIYPPCPFRMVDALITNFHLPRSTLLMLASAFAAPGAVGGRELVLSAYQEAIRQRYRFFSYGDAMLIC